MSFTTSFLPGKENGFLKGLDGLKVLESEAPLAVEVVAQE